VKPGREFVDQVGRKHMPVPHRQVLPVSAHFAERRKSGKNRRPRIQEDALGGVVVVLKVTAVEIVAGAESMVPTNHVVGPGKLCRWVPTESGGVQPITYD